MSAANNQQEFFSKVKVLGEDECWEWAGCLTQHGYGRLMKNGKMLLAHRVAYEFCHGIQLRAEHHIMHLCDNPTCVNSRHLALGDAAKNARDRQLKGRNNRHTNFDKLSPQEVLKIQSLLAFGMRKIDLAKQFKVNYRTIDTISRF